MGKATELKNTTDLVKEILKRHPETRNSDDILYLKVCEQINGISVHLPFKEVILNRKAFFYPPFESVRRSRQKVQANHPELAGNSTVEGHRKVNEQVFREYARERT